MTDFGNEYTTLYVRAVEEDSDEELKIDYVSFEPQPRGRSSIILGVLLGALVLCAVAAVCVPASLHGGDMLRVTRSSLESQPQVVHSHDEEATRAAKAAVAQLQLIQRRPDEHGSANPFALPTETETGANRERRR